MSSSLSIANQALTLLGANYITDFDDGSNEATICNELYTPTIKNLLSSTPWSFSTKKVELTKEADAPLNEFSCQFIRPAEAFFIFRVFDSNSTHISPISDYTLMQDKILANDATIYVEYCYYADESLWPGYFEEFAIHAFAAKIAVPIMNDPELANYYNAKAYGTPSQGGRGGLFQRASLAEGQQKPPRRFKQSPLTRSRFEGHY